MAFANLGIQVESSSAEQGVLALNKLTAASKEAQSAANNLAKGTNTAATAAKGMQAAVEHESSSLRKQAIAANEAANGNQKYAASAGQARMATSSVASQFSDIGVSLASGQNWWTVAIQQSSQLQYALGPMGVKGALSAVGSGLMSLLSPVSLLTFGVVAAGAALADYLFLSDDGTKSANLSLEDQRDLISGIASEWGTAAPAIYDYYEQLERARKQQELLAGTDIAIADKYSAAKDAAYELWTQMTLLLEQFQAMQVPEGEINKLTEAYNDLEEKIANGTATAYDADKVIQLLNADIYDGVDDVDNLQKGFERLGNMLGYAAPAADTLRASLLPLLSLGKEIQNWLITLNGDPLLPDTAPKPTSAPNREDAGAENDKRIARAGRKGATEAERLADRYKDIVRNANQATEAFENNQRALYMTEEAASRLRNEQELLNKAADAGIKLSPAMREQLMATASMMTSAEIAYNKSRETMELTKDSVKGFISTLRSGLENGENFWQAMGNAALSTLDKINDKLQNELLDSLMRLFEVGKGGSSGGGGFLESIFGGLFGGGGGGFTPFEQAFTGLPGLWAKGGAFNKGRTIPFAKGAVFNSPQIFPMANGSIGMMAEAGEEAIMPLKRGSDGKLGVAASGAGGQATRVEVLVYVQDDGTLGAIARQAGAEAAEVRVEQLDASLPNKVHGKIQSVQQDPRKMTGAW